MNHFDELSCLLYLEGELDPSQALELAAHAERCHSCHELLASLEGETRLLQRTLIEEQLEPAPLAEPAATIPAWLWTTCLLSIAGGGVTLWLDWIRPLLQGMSGYGIDGVGLVSSTAFDVFFWRRWATLGQTLEAVAVLAIGMMLLSVLRGLRMRGNSGIVGMGCLALLLLLPAKTQAQQTKTADFYTLPAGQTVAHNLFLKGNDLQINGTVEGDVVAFAHSLTINGKVDGDVISFTQFLTVNGEVDGNIRTFSQVLEVNGKVQRAVSAFVNRVELGPQASIGREVTFIADSLAVQGQLNRGILGMARTTQIDGHVDGNVLIHGSELRLTPGAEVQGHLAFTGPNPPSIDAQAKVDGGVEFHREHHISPWRTGSFYWHQALKWAAGFLAGVVLLLLFPGQVRTTLQGTRHRPALTLGVGAVALVATPLLVVLTAMTMVGMAIAVMTLLLFGIALYLAEVLSGFFLGQMILCRIVKKDCSAWVALAIGLLIVRIAVNIPYLGGWLLMVILIFGLGAEIRALWQGLSTTRAQAGEAAGRALRDPLRLES